MKKLLLVAAVIGLIAIAVKKRSSDRADWQGLTESQAREKLHDRFPDRMPAEKRDMVADKIVGVMRDKGVVVADDEVDLTDTVDLDADRDADAVEDVAATS